MYLLSKPLKITLPLFYLAFISCSVFAQDSIPELEIQENGVVDFPQESTPSQKVRVDTVVVEKVRIDTVYLPLKEEPQTQIKHQEPEPETKEPPPESNSKNNKVYKGAYANFSFGNYTVIGIEPLIAYKLLPKLSVGAKLSYEYVKNKNYSPARQGSNYGAAAFTRLRFGKRLYGHVEYSEMNYKLYYSNGDSDRQWISFLYVGGGISLPMGKRASINAEILWDVLQEDNSPYKTVEPFVKVGVVAGF